jgi:hypothetical protein
MNTNSQVSGDLWGGGGTVEGKREEGSGEAGGREREREGEREREREKERGEASPGDGKNRKGEYGL